MAKNELEIRLARRDLIIALIGSIIAVNSVIVFSNPEGKAFLSNWAVNATVVIALGLALITMYRQKLNRVGRKYASLVVGLALWFVAERISMYYEFGVATETMFPSFVDALRLMGYAFFAYHLFRAYQFSSKSFIPYWELLSLSMLISAIAYGGSVNSLTTNIVEIWIWDLLYNASYLCIASALFWYNRFFIFKKTDEGKSGGKTIVRPYIK